MNEKKYASVTDELDIVKGHARRNSTRRFVRKGCEEISAISDMKTRIGYLSTLKRGWDGYDASPLSAQVVINLNMFLASANEEDLAGWRALPEINGTVSLQNDELKAGIQIGDTAFSYFVISANHVNGCDNLPFAVSSVLTILRKINA